MLPKINSVRKKDININGKTIEINPWSNMQLINFEESLKDNTLIDSINDILIKDNVKSKVKLTLTEKRFVLVELYKLSKSSLLDISYTCNECSAISKFSINLEKSIEFKPLAKRVIKTKDFTFNFRENSRYEINLIDSDLNKETLKYFISFIDSFIYKTKSYEIQDLDETAEWFNTEMPSEDFDLFMIEFNKIKPDMITDVNVTCESCEAKTKIDFRIEDFLT